MYKTIPYNAVEIQTGLYLLETYYVVSGVGRIRREIFSSYGYQFWNRLQPENYDEDGNLLPLEKRSFSTYARLSSYYTTIGLINADFISVKKEDS